MLNGRDLNITPQALQLLAVCFYSRNKGKDFYFRRRLWNVLNFIFICHDFSRPIVASPKSIKYLLKITCSSDSNLQWFKIQRRRRSRHWDQESMMALRRIPFPETWWVSATILEPIGAGQFVTHFSGASLLLNFGRVNNSSITICKCNWFFKCVAAYVCLILHPQSTHPFHKASLAPSVSRSKRWEAALMLWPSRNSWNDWHLIRSQRFAQKFTNWLKKKPCNSESLLSCFVSSKVDAAPLILTHQLPL